MTQSDIGIVEKLLSSSVAAELPRIYRKNDTELFVNPDGPEAAAIIMEMVEALEDALAGWRYIRRHHGDLYGVGWDRVEQKLDTLIAKVRDPRGMKED